MVQVRAKGSGLEKSLSCRSRSTGRTPGARPSSSAPFFALALWQQELSRVLPAPGSSLISAMKVWILSLLPSLGSSCGICTTREERPPWGPLQDQDFKKSQVVPKRR